MSHRSQSRIGIYLIIAVAVFFVLSALQNKPSYSPVGLLLPGQHSQAATAENVTIVPLQPGQSIDPNNYIGTIHIEQFGKVPLKQAEHAILEKAALLAKQAGANQVYLQTLFRTSATTPTPLSNYFFSGVAVYKQNNREP